MILIAYKNESNSNASSSNAAQGNLQERLGEIDYSGYVTFERYLTVLETLGSVVQINDPATDIDNVLSENPSERCIFLSFAPPHLTLAHPRCPTVCIFAWELSSLPDDEWESQCEANLVAALAKIGNAIALSGYTADVITQSSPERMHVVAIPAPMVAPVASPGIDSTSKGFAHSLVLNAELYDSRDLAASDSAVENDNVDAQAPANFPQWNDALLEIAFSESNSDAAKLLAGFYAAETWGVWSRTNAPKIYLPVTLEGPIVITLELIAYGENIGRNIRVAVGDSRADIVPTDQPQMYEAHLHAKAGEDALCFSNLDLASAPGGDYRTLGVGIKQLTIRRPDGYRRPLSLRIREKGRELLDAFFGSTQSGEVEAGNALNLTGVVYTSVFNPEDSHKNWEDMVTAFCWAFREEAGATLLLKMSNHNTATFLGTLKLLFSTLPAFKCRVVAVHGFLNNEEMQAITQATHYVVNSSLCEGQGLSLMEFMVCGVPAIAPDHTAMADYVNEENAFVVASSLQPGFWPIDERKSLSTLRYRIDWMSLRDAFEESYRLVMSDGDAYGRMRRNSIRSVTDFAGEEVVTKKLNEYLSLITQ